MEYPIETADTEPQVLVFATNVKGDVTWAPFAGVVTVMADAVAAHIAITKRAEKKCFIKLYLDFVIGALFMQL